jgi:toxin ParE1/3/4
MKQFELTNDAKSDLRKIAIYTKNKWGKEQRNKYLSIIDNAFNDLASGSLQGQILNFRTGYKKYYVGKHIVFFRDVSENTIQIVRILHQSMDAEVHL